MEHQVQARTSTVRWLVPCVNSKTHLSILDPSGDISPEDLFRGMYDALWFRDLETNTQTMTWGHQGESVFNMEVQMTQRNASLGWMFKKCNYGRAIQKKQGQEHAIKQWVERFQEGE